MNNYNQETTASATKGEKRGAGPEYGWAGREGLLEERALRKTGKQQGWASGTC